MMGCLDEFLGNCRSFRVMRLFTASHLSRKEPLFHFFERIVMDIDQSKKDLSVKD